MTSRRKRNLMLAGKWAGYFVLLLLAATLQTTPGFLVLGEIRPVFILPLCLGVAAALLFNRFTQYLTARAGVELSLTISAPTFCLIAAAQMLVVLAGAFAFARAPKPHGRRRG